MPYYKDMTFCNYQECGRFAQCLRALTIEIYINAHQAGQSIVTYAEKPECFRDREDDGKLKGAA